MTGIAPDAQAFHVLVLGGNARAKAASPRSLSPRTASDRSILLPAPPATTRWPTGLPPIALRRGDEWTTIEEPLQLAAAIERAAGEGTAILVDCLSLWLSNLIEAGRQVDEESAALCGALASVAVPVVIVSNEVGSGIIPAQCASPPLCRCPWDTQSKRRGIGWPCRLHGRRPAAGRQTIATPGDKTLNVPANVPANAERIPATIVTVFSAQVKQR